MSELVITHGKHVYSETIYEGRVVRKDEGYVIEKFTDRNTMLKDVIEALEVITSGVTHKLDIQVCVDNKGRYKITRRWDV